MGDWGRELTVDERRRIAAARRKAFLLYEGVATPHRSCGIALAETFDLPTRPYQSLRRGGLTGGGACGTVMAGRLILGEVLGDPDPTGPVTPALKAAIEEFEARWAGRIDRGAARGDSIVCNDLVAQFADFRGPARASFCTQLATEVATLLAEVFVRNDVPFEVSPIEGVPGSDPSRP